MNARIMKTFASGNPDPPSRATEIIYFSLLPILPQMFYARARNQITSTPFQFLTFYFRKVLK